MAIEDDLIEQAARLLKKNDKDGARALLQELAEVNPKNHHCWTLLAETTDNPDEKVIYLRHAEEIIAANDALQNEIKQLQAKTATPKSFWTKTNRIRAGFIFLVFTLIPSLWWVFFDVIPTLRTVKQMTGEWNVAVISFTNLTDDLNREDIFLISNIFSNRFRQDLQALSTNADLVIQVWGPKDVDRFISGKTAAQRAVEAEKLATALNADLVVYGVIQPSSGEYLLQPEFFIRAENYYEADELIGQHRFGSQIPIVATQDTLPSQLPLNLELTRRSSILALTARGLSFYLIRSYQQALDFFTQANQDDLWQNSEGRETMYLLQGNAAMKMQDLNLAAQAYTKAVEIEPNYGRGFIGLGSVSYRLAAESSSQISFTPDRQALAQAQDYYEQALRIVDTQPASAEIPSKAAFGLGQISLTEWFLGDDTRAQAMEYFQKVIADYANGEKLPLQELASEAHARLAIIYRQDGDKQSAIAEFQQAILPSTLSERKGLYWASLSDLYQQIPDREQAIHASHQAIDQYRLALLLTLPDQIKVHYWFRVGAQYEYLQETDQAIQAYENAIALVPEGSADLSIYQQRLERLKP